MNLLILLRIVHLEVLSRSLITHTIPSGIGHEFHAVYYEVDNSELLVDVVTAVAVDVTDVCCILTPFRLLNRSF